MAVVEHEIGQLKSMRNGYLGKLLVVDLSTSKTTDERLSEDLLRDFIGGYGVGARLLLERMHPGTDPRRPRQLPGLFHRPAHRYRGSVCQSLHGCREVPFDDDLGRRQLRGRVWTLPEVCQSPYLLPSRGATQWSAFLMSLIGGGTRHAPLPTVAGPSAFLLEIRMQPWTPCRTGTSSSAN